MNPEQSTSEKDRRRALRQQAAMDPAALYNTDQAVWDKALEWCRKRADGGPTFRVLEGNVWGVPRVGWVARFETSEEAERVLLAAGFKHVPAEKGFRA